MRRQGRCTGRQRTDRTVLAAIAAIAVAVVADAVVLTASLTDTGADGRDSLIDKAPAQVAPPPLERDAPAWVAVSGAVSAGEQYVTLTLQGSGKDTVVLDSLTVRTAARCAPLTWKDCAMGYPGRTSRSR